MASPSDPADVSWAELLNMSMLGKEHRKQVSQIGRIMLCATFFDDGLRILWGFSDQCSLLQHTALPGFLVYPCAVLQAVLQLVGSGCVMSNRCVPQGCACFFAFLLIASPLYAATPALHPGASSFLYVLRQLGILGGVLTLLASRVDDKDNADVLLPTSGSEMARNSMESLTRRIRTVVPPKVIVFAARIMNVLLAGIAGPLDRHPVFGVICVLAAICVLVGYNTDASTVVLAAIMTVFALTENTVLVHEQGETFYLCQEISVIGGLLLLLAHGPGELSVDAKRSKDL